MKKLLLLTTILLITNIVNAQWSYQTVNDGFEEPYRIAYTKESANAILKLEENNGTIYFYISGSYYCDEYPSVDFVFMVNGQPKRYTINGITSESKQIIFFTTDLLNDTIFEDFKHCSILKIRINESYCSSNIYTFNMTNSTNAFNFMINKK